MVSVSEKQNKELREQIKEVLNEELGRILVHKNEKSENDLKNLFKVNEFMLKISEIEHQITHETIVLSKLESEEREVNMDIIDIKNKIVMLNFDFRQDLNQIKWNQFLVEFKSYYQSLLRKQKEKFNTEISRLIDYDIEERLEKAKNGIAEKESELGGIEFKLTTLKQQIEIKRNEICELLKNKKRVTSEMTEFLKHLKTSNSEA